METLGEVPGSGFIVLPDVFNAQNRSQLIRFAETYRLPAVYPYRHFVENGGLISDGIDSGEVFQRSAAYFDRILKGANPASLPVEQPTAFTLAIHLATAARLGITIPPSLLQRADLLVR